MALKGDVAELRSNLSRPVIVRRASAADFEAIWPIFQAVVADGDSYVFAADTGREDAHAYWFGPGISAWVAQVGAEVVGMYKLLANQRDLGSHVANASFMVSPAAHGRGVGRVMGEHALVQARGDGYLAMQFNIVVSTNTAALALWKKLGFAIVGTVPGAFRHRTLGYVDTYVMHRFLNDIAV